MVTTEERLRILQMIQEGKISAEEGAQLIEILEGSDPGLKPESKGSGVAGAAKTGGKWFRVRVTDTNTGKNRVYVRLPIGLVSSGIKMGAHFSPEVQGLDIEQLMEAISRGETGQVVDVIDDEDGEHVEVFIE